MELARDLGSADVWADSLERSLARRGRPRRASLELGRLNPERDLADADMVNESVVYWRTRRSASASSTFSAPAVGGASALALLAATTLPSLAGSSRPAPARGGHHRPGAAGAGTQSARTVVHHSAPANPIFTTAPVVTATAAPSSIVLDAATAAPAPHRVSYGKVTHGDVRDAQRMLGLSIDGVLGPKTGAAIRAFQSAHGLTVDGNVGPATWDALKNAEHAAARAAGASTAVTTTATAAGTVHEASAFQAATTTSDTTDVIAVQQALGIPADGTFGAETTTAVEAFQTAHGMTADGVVGPGTRSALGLPAGPTLQQSDANGGTTGPGTNPATTTTAAVSPAAPADPAVTTDPTAAGATTSTPAGSTAITTSTTPSDVTTALSEMVAAANQIATLPYIWGGGHGSFISPGYDCSGSVSYVLHAAGLLSVPEDSSGLESYGAPGPGQYITIYANAGHAWMTIGGRRFDTVSLSESGTRWSDGGGEFAGFVVRHPVGF